MTTPNKLEPLRAEPTGFLVHHLNHSVAVSLLTCDSMPDCERLTSTTTIA